MDGNDDVYLNMLSIPNYENSSKKKFKESYERIQRTISMDEFITAFCVIKGLCYVVYKAFPNRYEELDLYLAHINETANISPDRFSEYHKWFSANCAIMLLQHNIKRYVNWF